MKNILKMLLLNVRAVKQDLRVSSLLMKEKKLERIIKTASCEG